MTGKPHVKEQFEYNSVDFVYLLSVLCGVNKKRETKNSCLNIVHMIFLRIVFSIACRFTFNFFHMLHWNILFSRVCHMLYPSPSIQNMHLMAELFVNMIGFYQLRTSDFKIFYRCIYRFFIQTCWFKVANENSFFNFSENLYKILFSTTIISWS